MSAAGTPQEGLFVRSPHRPSGRTSVESAEGDSLLGAEIREPRREPALPLNF